jgi:hypothetical protein
MRTAVKRWERTGAIMELSRPMKRTLLWLIVAAILVIGLVLYRSRSGRNLDVDPHAREVIEKAKRR